IAATDVAPQSCRRVLPVVSLALAGTKCSVAIANNIALRIVRYMTAPNPLISFFARPSASPHSSLQRQSFLCVALVECSVRDAERHPFASLFPLGSVFGFASPLWSAL